MGSLFRVGKKWRYQYLDHAHNPPRKTTKTLSAHKATAEAAAKVIDLKQDRLMHGVDDANATKLARAAARPVKAHVDDWAKDIASGTTEKYAAEMVQAVRRFVAHVKLQTVADLTPGRIRTGVDTMPRERGEGTLSHRTKNKTRAALWLFCDFLRKDGRLAANPVMDVATWDEKKDPRHQRRALSDEETNWLLNTTLTGPERGRVSGEDRWRYYHAAQQTGLRLGELESIRVRDFHFRAASGAFVRVLQTNTKNKREVDQPLTAEFAAEVRTWLEGRKGDALAFHFPSRPAEVLERDLAAAREAWLATATAPEERAEMADRDFLRYVDSAGKYADFHAIGRHTYITNVVRTGGLAVAQELARHSTPILTKRYTHLERRDLDKGLAGLPRPAAKDAKKRDVAG